MKKITNYELQKFETNSIKKEIPSKTNDIEILKEENKRVIKKFNTLANQYVKIRNNVYAVNKTNQELKEETEYLKAENEELQKENNRLKNYIDKSLEYVSLLFDFSKARLKRLIDSFVKEFNQKEK